MAKSRKVVITCAITGSIHTPSISPHLPVTPDEIATPDEAREILALKGADQVAF
jgi:uncharacterized protein (DUF849 family)